MQTSVSDARRPTKGATLWFRANSSYTDLDGGIERAPAVQNGTSAMVGFFASITLWPYQEGFSL